MNINHILLPEEILKNKIKYSYLKQDGNANRRDGIKYKSLDLSYILGKMIALLF